jgi:hypothetical protein
VALTAGILWDRAAVYSTYVEGHCAITSVSSFVTRTGKNGLIRYTSLSYTLQSVTGQRAEATRSYPDAYYYLYSVGTTYPCWYDPADLTGADLDHHSGPFDTFSTNLTHGNHFFVGNNNFLTWSMLLGFAYLFFALLWNYIFSVIHFRRHALSTGATVLSVATERRRKGKHGTRLVNIAFVAFTAQDGASYRVKIDATLQPATVVPLWYDATNPAKGARITLPAWNSPIFSACISLIPLGVVVYMIYVGWTAF